MNAAGLRHVEYCMGTVFSFVVVGTDDGSVLEPALARLHQIDANFSTYRADSPISRLGRGEATLTDCPPDVALVLSLCAQATQDTDGWFSALADGRLDPSGLVKGWAVEEASRLLASAGYPHHCINGGGDVLGAGGRWRFGIDDPRHIIDPFTRRSTTALASVKVIGPSLTRADVLATAACARGISACDWLAAVDGYDSVVVRADGTTWTSPDLPSRLASASGPSSARQHAGRASMDATLASGSRTNT